MGEWSYRPAGTRAAPTVCLDHRLVANQAWTLAQPGTDGCASPARVASALDGTSDGNGPLRGQGAIHPVPAQFPVGACPSTRPGEPPVAGTRMGRWGRTRRLAPDHRPGLHHLRDLWTGQRRGATPQLHRRAGLSPSWPSPPDGVDLRSNTAPALLETVGRVRYPAANSRAPTAAPTVGRWVTQPEACS